MMTSKIQIFFAKRTVSILVMSMVFVCFPHTMLVAVAQSVSPQSVAGNDQPIDNQWIRSENRISFLRFRVRVLMPDGSIATGAHLTVSKKEALQVTNDEKGHFEFETELTNGYEKPISLLASSADGELAGQKVIYQHDLRSVARNGINVQLGPMRTISVKVANRGLAVANASVLIAGSLGRTIEGTTDESGILNVNVPFDTEIDTLSAWTDDRHFGGYQVSRKPDLDPNATQYQVDLLDCHSQKIQVLDANNQPVANFEFDVSVALKPGYNYLPLYEKGSLVTDENGEATFEWFPEWDDFRFSVGLKDDKWSISSKEELKDGALLVHVTQPIKLQRQTITGRVNLPENVKGGFMVRLGSFEHPEDGIYDSLFVRCDEYGDFTADVMPGATYCVFLNDADWVSDYWTGIIYDPESGNTESPSLQIDVGESVELLVTLGPDHKPLRNVTVNLSQEHQFDWLEKGVRKSGSLGRGWRVRTDSQGCAATRAKPGKLTAYIYNPDWKPKTEVVVVASQTTSVRFHRKIPGKREITGRVRLPQELVATLYGAEVKLVPLDEESEGETESIVDSEGNFTFEMLASRIGAFVKTTDGLASGVFVSDNPDQDFEFELLPTVDYHGYMIDGNGKPMPDKWVRATLRLKDPAINWQNRNSFVKFNFDVQEISTKTDANGEFVLKSVSQNILFVLSCQDDRNGSRGRKLGERFISPGEQRPPEMISFAEQPTGGPAKTMAAQIGGKLDDCRAADIYLLVTLAGAGVEIGDFVRSTIYDLDENKAMINYLPIWINGSSARDKPERREYFEAHDWDIPGENEVLLVVLDGLGNERSKKLIDITQEQATVQVKEFVAENVPAKVDAQAKYDAALAEARRTGRKVWVRVSQTRCAPCFLLSRWLEANQTALNRDYIMLKVDDVRDINGIEVASSLLDGKRVGIPYHQILDGDGKMLIDSIGPLGNIGYPGSFEGYQHMRKMLESTSRELTDKEIDNLVDSLDDG